MKTGLPLSSFHQCSASFSVHATILVAGLMSLRQPAYGIVYLLCVEYEGGGGEVVVSVEGGTVEACCDDVWAACFFFFWLGVAEGDLVILWLYGVVALGFERELVSFALFVLFFVIFGHRYLMIILYSGCTLSYQRLEIICERAAFR